MPEGRLERTRRVYGIPSEIVNRYRAGEREIGVSGAVFQSYSDNIVARRAFVVRVGGRPAAKNDPPMLMYKDAKVILMK